MAATIEVILTDGGGTAAETQSASEAGQRAQSTGAAPSNVSLDDVASRLPKDQRDLLSVLPPAERDKILREYASSAPAGENRAARTETPTNAQPQSAGVDGKKFDELISSIQGLASHIERQTKGTAPAGSRRSDESIVSGDGERIETTEAKRLDAKTKEAIGNAGKSETESEESSKWFDSLTEENKRGNESTVKAIRDLVDKFRGDGDDKETPRDTVERTERVESTRDRERVDRSSSKQSNDRSEDVKNETLRERITREIFGRLANTGIGRKFVAARNATTEALQSTRAFRQGASTSAGRAILGRAAPAAASSGAASAGTNVARAGTVAAGSAATGATAGTATTAAAAGTGTTTAGAATAGGSAASGTATGGTLAAVAGPVGIAVAAVVVALGALAYGVKKTVDIFREQADELESVSGPVASVRGIGQARAEVARVERARSIGPQTAQVEAARLRLSEAGYEVQTKLYELLASQANKVEAGLDTLTAILKSLVTIKDAIDILLASNPLTGNPLDAPKEIKEFRESAKELTNAVKEIFNNGADLDGRIDPELLAILQMDDPDVPIAPNQDL